MNDLLDTPVNPRRNNSFKPAPLICWSTVLFIGLYFRFMHYPFSSHIILFSAAVITAYSWSGWLRLRGKSRLNNVMSIIAIVWVLILTWGNLYNGGHPYNEKGTGTFWIFFAAAFLFYVVYNYLRRPSSRS